MDGFRLPELNRPEYVMAPEALITALAWKAFRSDDAYAGSPKQRGYVYRSEAAPAKSLETITTYPATDEEMRAFSGALNGVRVPSEHEGLVFAEAVANSIRGTRPKKSKNQLASPLTPNLALLQDSMGSKGKANPPDYGLILEQLYRLGVPIGETRPHPARLWLAAAEHRRSSDPLLARVDAAVGESLLPFSVTPRNQTETLDIPGSWDFQSTPFSWFVEAWCKLTSAKWVDALPARIWVDWASTVLRLAFGLGYLWEATWYEALGRQVLSGGTDLNQVSARRPEIIPWRPSDSPTSVRDVASLLKWRVRRGNKVRDVWIKNRDSAKDNSFDLDPNFTRQIDQAISNPGTAVNTWEAIRYALMTRDPASPSFADHYGLLRSSGRYLWVQPGTEWMAVVASLACSQPGGATDVQHVMTALHELGLRPELRDVLLLLEAAGLARGSADADYGVEVRSAF